MFDLMHLPYISRRTFHSLVNTYFRPAVEKSYKEITQQVAEVVKKRVDTVS